VTADSRLTRIPVQMSDVSTLEVRPAIVFDWEWPDGTVQNGQVCTYAPAAGEGLKTVYIQMKDGYTVADITNFLYGNIASDRIEISDLIHMRPSANFYQLFALRGDVALLKDVVASPATGIYLHARNHCLSYGSIDDWLPVKASTVWLYSYDQNLTGSVKFIADSPTAALSFLGSNPGAAAISQTIINWDAANAATFTRTGNFNQVKRSELTAAGEAAVVSLISKGSAFTFKSE